MANSNEIAKGILKGWLAIVSIGIVFGSCILCLLFSLAVSVFWSVFVPIITDIP